MSRPSQRSRPESVYSASGSSFVSSASAVPIHDGEAHPDRVLPEIYLIEQAFLDRLGNAEIQLDLFLDYRHNAEAYSSVHTYFKQPQPPLLAVWGAGDELFVPAGAEAFNEVLPDAKHVMIDGAGHFALENHSDEVIKHVREFLGGLSG
ncbi:alpha/beta hydrolase fold protein [Rhodotorula toruloides]|uniref:Alpha/beta hydrolase fold protein n=1 Tax=Rhodotorula toruloides TaxID=5286 RepID=A0A511KNN6_RHOTO|nr:alpha/beta hydrolase fold protein [Rhodotorula toruloides]